MKNFCIKCGKIIVVIKVVFYAIIKKTLGKKLIVDISGTVLKPGNGGQYCKGNGKHLNWRGKTIECCCDECDYLMCCTEQHID